MNCRKITAIILCVACLLAIPCTASAADYSYVDPVMLTVHAGGNTYAVRGYNSDYVNNLYLSMTDLAAALKCTSAAFSFEFGSTTNDGEFFSITRISPAESADESYTAVEDTREAVWLEFKRNRLFYNGGDRKYYTFRDTENDLYMNLTDIQLMLDITASLTGENEISFNTNESFCPDVKALGDEGFFDYISGIIVGDATTGEVIYSKDKNAAVPVASTSKLMSYLLIAEAIAAGKIGYDDLVPISLNAEKLSKSADGIIKLTAGTSIPLSELLSGMMVASSNECALALAEYISGSEEKFVEEMNARAKEMRLSSAVFYNCNGLPVYSESSVSYKKQNIMSAADLFTLSAYILKAFPATTDITKNQYVSMPNLEYTTANSNPLVFNMEGVTGLKTGSTKRAGQCLVASMPVEKDGAEHNIVLVILGAENASERGQMAEMLLKYAVNQLT